VVSENTLLVDIHAAIGGFKLAVNFSTSPGITVLFGPSGCGKSSTLNCLAGLIKPSSGRIRFGDEKFFDSDAGIDLPPQERRIGYVFQHASLFPHMTVQDNIAFGLTRLPGTDRLARVAELVDMLHLHGLEQRKPHEISGGQQQRVALARALAINPRILLLDEPFGSLDDDLRKQLGDELVQIQKQLQLTIIFVTHSRHEAQELGQHLVQMDAGRVSQSGTPDTVLGV
jgi:molybdate transport system ATP-binding protein